MTTKTPAKSFAVKFGLRWLMDHKYITSALFILFVCIALFVCQLVYDNIGSISSLTAEEFRSIIKMDTMSPTPLSTFVSSYFHMDMSHLLNNVLGYALFSGLVLLTIWAREGLRKKPMPPYYLFCLNVLTVFVLPVFVSLSSVIGWRLISAESVDVIGFSGVVTAIVGIFLIQLILLAGSYSYKSMRKSDPGLFRSLSGLFAFLFCLTTVFVVWTAGLFVLTMDVVGLMDGDLINFFGHVFGFILGVILALVLEKLPEAESEKAEG
ncbi:hypothetical protein [uncultured Methanocorpusculum sp.]|nr:hypothetical protein [uncultured Methanocorpusculum sp.]